MNHDLMTLELSTTIPAGFLFSGPLRQKFRLQNTIDKSIFVQGFGFWTGEDVTIEFRPSRPNSGIRFVRADLAGHPRIPALVQYRDEKPRQTSLVKNEARVDMVEHVLAAVCALKIDNCEIWTDRPEMPGFDGSSIVFVSALERAKVVSQPAIRPMRLVTRAFRIGSDNNWIDVLPSRNGQNTYRYSLIVDSNYPIDNQECSFDFSTEVFRREIADSRTFITKHEAEYLLSRGLCRRVSPSDVLVLDVGGPVDNRFRYENECARHKVLDMIGDFSLIDCDWIGTFESYRGSHSLNAECVRVLLENTILLDDSFVPGINRVKRAA